MREKKLNLLHHKECGDEFTVTLGFGRGNIEEKSGERLEYPERSALNACGLTVTPKNIHVSLVHDIRSGTLNNDENLVLSTSPLRRFYNALKRGGYADVGYEWPSQ